MLILIHSLVLDFVVLKYIKGIRGDTAVQQYPKGWYMRCKWAVFEGDQGPYFHICSHLCQVEVKQPRNTNVKIFLSFQLQFTMNKMQIFANTRTNTNTNTNTKQIFAAVCARWKWSSLRIQMWTYFLVFNSNLLFWKYISGRWWDVFYNKYNMGVHP